jgi:hypothetical protein
MKYHTSLGVAVIPPIYGDVFRQNALFAPKCGKITAIPREPVSYKPKQVLIVL